MINTQKLEEVLAEYRRGLVTPDPGSKNETGWDKEGYKWRNIAHFQSVWDIDAPDFSAMFMKATEKQYNLLDTVSKYPRAVIQDFCKKDQEAVRAMFRYLYDETLPVVDRMKHFMDEAERLRMTYGEGKWKSHFQDMNAVSVYLWFMYPDKYYIYKYTIYREVVRLLEGGFKVKKGASVELFPDFLAYYDEIAEYLKNEKTTAELLRSLMNSGDYPDPELRTLTIDVGFYIARYFLPNHSSNNGVSRAWFVGAMSDTGDDLTEQFVNEHRWENGWEEEKFADEVNSVAVGDRIVIKYSYVKQKVPFKTDGEFVSALGIKAIGTVTANSMDGKHLSVDWEKVEPKKEWFDNCCYRDTIRLVTASDGENQKALLDFVFKNVPQDYTALEKKYAGVHYWPSPEEYDPHISEAQWKEYIENVEMNGHKGCMAVLKGMLLLGGEATCKKLADTYGGHSSSYVGSVINIGKRAKKYFDLPPCIDVDVERYFPVAFLGRNVYEDGAKFYSWKLRPELESALKQIDLSGISPYYNDQENEEDVNYWWLNANPKIWSFSDIEVGKEQSYTLLSESGHKRRIYQNFLDARPGDVVVGYESTPVKQVVALARISQEQDGKTVFFEKTEGLAVPVDYAALKECPELENMEYFRQPQGSLFKLTKEEYECIEEIIREENPVSSENNAETYTKERFLSEVFMPGSRYDALVSLLRNKKNVILQGAPGVGKTFAAKRLAYSMIGKKDDSRIEFVQFHQNYSYEDFMMGYKPAENGFELKYGIFYRFCQIAANQPGKDFFFIIDEINRGNMSKIFGELLMLIEKEYRGTKTTLAYNGLPFAVPDNLYIIGMMNTADRSLAMIDYALRRRFSFYTMGPGFETEGFKAYQAALNDPKFDKLISAVISLNNEIANDRSLGPGFCIGHSYFCGHRPEDNSEWLKGIVEYDIIPMLNEYWFDEPDTVKKWADQLNGAING